MRLNVYYTNSPTYSSGDVWVEVYTLWGDGLGVHELEEEWPERYRHGTVYAASVFTFYVTQVQANDDIYLVSSGAVSCADGVLNATHAAVRGAGKGSVATIDTVGLPIGDYYFCHSPNGLGYEMQRNYRVHLSGPIDPYRSQVCCANNTMLAGDVTTCQVYAVDEAGDPTGAMEDECSFGYTHIRGGGGEDLCVMDAAPHKAALGGVFEFSFVSYTSGCYGRVGVAYRGVLLGSKVAMLTFVAGIPYSSHATSECAADPTTGALQCNVTKRDLHHNPTEICHTYYGSNPSPLHCEKV